MNIVKYWFARWIEKRMQIEWVAKKGDVTDRYANKWNHIQAIIITRGRLKLNWDLIFERKFKKCHRCAKKMSLKSRRRVCEDCLPHILNHYK